MPSWPDLVALELLVAVADEGSLSAGARAAGVAQPNASRSLARLERQLGLPLLVRSTRGSTMTTQGLLVVEWARPLLAAATTLAEGARTLRAADGGSLTVAASQTVAEHLLPRWLSALRTARPDVTVAAHVHNSSGVVSDVREGRADLGFVEAPSVPRGTHSVVVTGDELVLVVDPSHAWAGRRTRVQADELAATPLVTREPGSGTRVALEEALAPRTMARPALELPSNAAVRVSVAAGSGPAVLSRLAVADAVAAGTLRIVEVATSVDLRRPLRAVWTGPRQLSGPAADLVRIAGH